MARLPRVDVTIVFFDRIDKNGDYHSPVSVLRIPAIRDQNKFYCHNERNTRYPLFTIRLTDVTCEQNGFVFTGLASDGFKDYRLTKDVPRKYLDSVLRL